MPLMWRCKPAATCPTVDQAFRLGSPVCIDKYEVATTLGKRPRAPLETSDSRYESVVPHDEYVILPRTPGRAGQNGAQGSSR
jgi:hypothetical protein